MEEKRPDGSGWVPPGPIRRSWYFYVFVGTVTTVSAVIVGGILLVVLFGLIAGW